MDSPSSSSAFSWTQGLLRAALSALVFALLLAPLLPPWILGATSLASACGAFVASGTRGWSKRSIAVLIAVGILGWLPWNYLPYFTQATHALNQSPRALASLALLVQFAPLGFCIAFLSTHISKRFPAWTAVEAALVALGTANLFAAHRQGAIQRPYEWIDPIVQDGGDPTVFFAVFGGAVAFACALLWFQGKSLRSFALAVLFLCALAWPAMHLVESRRFATPPQTSDRLTNSEGQGGGFGQSRGEMEFNDNPNPTSSPVAVVLFESESNPEGDVYYFRQSSLERFNGSRVVHAESIASATNDSVADLQASVVRTDVATTVGLLEEHGRRFGLESPLRIETLQNPNGNRFRDVYRVHSRSLEAPLGMLLGAKTENARWPNEARDVLTQGPDDVRYADLANEIVATLPEDLREDSVAKFYAIVDWLGNEGTYSLRHSRQNQDREPTAAFLFGDRIGYCVHFAHAAVYLARSIGIPTRVSTGYMIPAAARRGGSALVLSGRNAHAWPELYVEGSGWTVVDVTPKTSLDPQTEEADADLQLLYADLLRGLNPEERVMDERKTPYPWQPLIRAIAQVAASLALLWLGISFAVAWTRRWAYLFAGNSARWNLIAALEQMRGVGLRPKPGQSLRSFALQHQLPSLERLIALREQERLGRDRPPTSARSLLPLFQAEHQPQHALWKRFLGVFNPWPLHQTVTQLFHRILSRFSNTARKQNS